MRVRCKGEASYSYLTLHRVTIAGWGLWLQSRLLVYLLVQACFFTAPPATTIERVGPRPLPGAAHSGCGECGVVLAPADCFTWWLCDYSPGCWCLT